MCTAQASEGLVNMRFGHYSFDQTSIDTGSRTVVLDFTTSRYHFEGLDLTFNVVTGSAVNPSVAWEVIELDSFLTEFVLWEGLFNTKLTGESCGQQGFSSSTKWIGLPQDAIAFRWTTTGAILAQEWAGNFSVSAQAPHGTP